MPVVHEAVGAVWQIWKVAVWMPVVLTVRFQVVAPPTV